MPEDETRMVICNTSPMFYLHRIGHITCLPALYGRIILPESVCAELAVGRAEGYDAPDPAMLEWIDRRHTRVPELLHLITDFGSGEAEVIALGLELPESLLVLNDGLARRIARSHDMRITGTIGILCAAKRQGLLSNVKESLDALLQVGFRMRSSLYQEICHISGED